MKFFWAILFVVFATAFAAPRVQKHRGLTSEGNDGEHPYLFVSVPRGRSSDVVKGFEIIEEFDDGDDEDNDDDHLHGAFDDDEDEFVGNNRRVALRINEDNESDDDDTEGDDNEMPGVSANNLQMALQNVKNTQMLVSKEHAGAILVPDGIIEIEGQTVIDENTGKAALLVPSAALAAIPDGSVVALMERSVGSDDDNEEERANRVIVRRRRRGSRRNVRRRGGNRIRPQRVNGNRRRRVNKRTNVRVVRTGGKRKNRRRNNRRGNAKRPVQVIQG